ncbi:hypothetical protein UlMin_011279 [Ulmus minor]
MEDWNGMMMIKGSSFTGRSIRNEDFEEEDIWEAVKESEDSSPKTMNNKSRYNSSGSSSAWRVPTVPWMIPRANNPQTNDSKLVQQSSAPVEIPDWSKIYGKNTGNGVSYGDDIDDEEEKDDDDDGDDMVPPHEWIARKLARSQISSFSVCEGKGRKLKGRDLSKVRNAILTKTGFLE